MLHVIIVQLLLKLLFFAHCSAKTCSQDFHFSTKTPYSLIKNEDLEIVPPHPTCKAVHINMIHRHGHRYPSAKDARNFVAVEEVINKASSVTGIDLKLPWKTPFTVEQDKILTMVGEQELFDIGKRTRARFPEVFQHKYTPFTFKFQSSCKLRCTHSAISLAAGLFDGQGTLGNGKYQPIALETFPCHNDLVLRFFDLCEKYIVKIEKNPQARIEVERFNKGPYVQTVLNKIKQKLGNLDMPLKPKHLKSMFLACAYEIGMFGGNLTSGMCSLFDERDREVMEYALELKHFYIRSAGHKINYESSCPLLADMLNTLKAFVDNSTTSNYGIFRAAHAETIIPLYALLGVFKDPVKLTAANFEEMKSRKFRSACMSPFSGNLYFVLFNCGETYKIQMYANERLVQIPCCNHATDCDFNVFVKCYQEIVNNCNLGEMCKHRNDEL